MADKLMYIPNDDIQNYPLQLQLVVDKFNKSPLICKANE